MSNRNLIGGEKTVKKLLLWSLLFVSFLLVSENASAQTKVRVRFAKGAVSAKLKGRVNGYKYIDYIVRAKSGQTMSVSLGSKNTACKFVIFYSDMKNVEGAADVKEFTRNVDVDDNYVVRVLLPRSAARRKERAAFTLNVKIE